MSRVAPHATKSPKRLRDYQDCVLKDGLRRNTIAMLPTNSGKTLIATAMIHEYLANPYHLDKIILFLAPTVLLTTQQRANVMKEIYHDPSAHYPPVFSGITHYIPKLEDLKKAFLMSGDFESSYGNLPSDPHVWQGDDLLPSVDWNENRKSLSKCFCQGGGFVDMSLGVHWKNPKTWSELYEDLAQYKKAVFAHWYDQVVGRVAESEGETPATQVPPSEKLLPYRRVWCAKIEAFKLEAAQFVAEDGELIDSDADEDGSEGESGDEEDVVARGGERLKADLSTVWPRVFFATPNLALKFFEEGFFRMDKICLIIFDECHHSDPTHPFSIIMKRFYQVAACRQQKTLSPIRPRVLGLTASPLDKKIDTLQLIKQNSYVEIQIARSISGKIRRLQNLYDSTIHIGHSTNVIDQTPEACSWMRSLPTARQGTISISPVPKQTSFMNMLLASVITPATRVMNQLFNSKHNSKIFHFFTKEEEAHLNPLRDVDLSDVWPILEHIRVAETDDLSIERDQDPLQYIMESPARSDRDHQHVAHIIDVIDIYKHFLFIAQSLLDLSREDMSLYVFRVMSQAEESDVEEKAATESVQESPSPRGDVEPADRVVELKLNYAKRLRKRAKAMRERSRFLFAANVIDACCRYLFDHDDCKEFSRCAVISETLHNVEICCEYNKTRVGQLLSDTGLFGVFEYFTFLYRRCCKVLKYHLKNDYPLEDLLTIRDRLFSQKEEVLELHKFLEADSDDLPCFMLKWVIRNPHKTRSSKPFEDFFRRFVVQCSYLESINKVHRDLVHQAVVNKAQVAPESAVGEEENPSSNINDESKAVIIESVSTFMDTSALDPIQEVYKELGGRGGIETQIQQAVENVLHKIASSPDLQENLSPQSLDASPEFIRRELMLSLINMLSSTVRVSCMRSVKIQVMPDEHIISEIITLFREQLKTILLRISQNLSALNHYLYVLFLGASLERHPVIAQMLLDCHYSNPLGILVESKKTQRYIPRYIISDKIAKLINLTRIGIRRSLKIPDCCEYAHIINFANPKDAQLHREELRKISLAENTSALMYPMSMDQISSDDDEVLVGPSYTDEASDDGLNTFRRRSVEDYYIGPEPERSDSLSEDSRMSSYESSRTYTESSLSDSDGGYSGDSSDAPLNPSLNRRGRRSLDVMEHRGEMGLHNEPRQRSRSPGRNRQGLRNQDENRSRDNYNGQPRSRQLQRFPDAVIPPPPSRPQFTKSGRHNAALTADPRLLTLARQSYRLIYRPEQLPTNYPFTVLSAPLKALFFVRTRLIAEFVARILNNQNVAKADFVTGQQTIRQHSELPQRGAWRYILRDAVSASKRREVLSRFRSSNMKDPRTIQILVATSVVEEGFDLPECNLVIRSDPPDTLSEHIQSRGRARAQDSQYILLQDSFCDHEMSTLVAWQKLEYLVLTLCIMMSSLTTTVAPVQEDNPTISCLPKALALEGAVQAFIPYSRAHSYLKEILRMLAIHKNQDRAYTEIALRAWLSSHKMSEHKLKDDPSLTLPPMCGFRGEDSDGERSFTSIQPIRLRCDETPRVTCMANALAIVALQRMRAAGILDEDFKAPRNNFIDFRFTKRQKKMLSNDLMNCEYLWRESPLALLAPHPYTMTTSDLRTTTEWKIVHQGSIPLTPEDELIVTNILRHQLDIDHHTEKSSPNVPNIKNDLIKEAAYLELLNEAAATQPDVNRFRDLQKYSRFRNEYDEPDAYIHEEVNNNTEPNAGVPPPAPNECSAELISPQMEDDELKVTTMDDVSAPKTPHQLHDLRPNSETCSPGFEARISSTPSAAISSADTCVGEAMCTVYPHRVWYTCNSWNSELLRLGGLMGYWRAFHTTDGLLPPRELLEFIGDVCNTAYEVDEEEKSSDLISESLKQAKCAQEARRIAQMCLAKMDIHRDELIMKCETDEWPADAEFHLKSLKCCQYPALRFSSNPWRVLQPMCVLLKNPLAEAVTTNFYYALTNEEYQVEIEPIRAECLVGDENWTTRDYKNFHQPIQRVINAAQYPKYNSSRAKYGQPISWELPESVMKLLDDINHKLRSKWAVATFRFPENPLLKSLDMRALSQANAKLSNLRPPFSIMAPLQADGLGLDITWCLNQVYLQPLYRAGNIRDDWSTERIAIAKKLTPPSILKMAQENITAIAALDPALSGGYSSSKGIQSPKSPISIHSSFRFCPHLSRLRNRQQGDCYVGNAANDSAWHDRIIQLIISTPDDFIRIADQMILTSYQPAVVVRKGENSKFGRLVTAERITMAYFLKKNLTERIYGFLTRKTKDIDITKFTAGELAAISAYNLLLRCGEVPLMRMTHERNKAFRFHSLDGFNWQETPFTYRSDMMYGAFNEGSTTLSDNYSRLFDREVDPENSFLVEGTKIRQGPRLSLYCEKVTPFEATHAPEFCLILPASASILEQISNSPALYWTIDVFAKRQELKLMLDLKFSRALPPPRDILDDTIQDDSTKASFVWQFVRGKQIVELKTAALPDFNVRSAYLDIAFTTSSALTRGGLVSEMAERRKLLSDLITPLLQDGLKSDLYDQSGPCREVSSLCKLWERQCRTKKSDLLHNFSQHFVDPKTLYENVASPVTRFQHSQVLEFVGDAVLKYLAAVWAYFNFPYDGEGVMSEKSDLIKKNAALRRGARTNRLHPYILARPFATRAHGQAIQTTLSDIRAQQLSFKQQADVVEALLGACYWSHFCRFDLFPAVSDFRLLTRLADSLAAFETEPTKTQLDMKYLTHLFDPIIHHPHWCGSAAGSLACAALTEGLVMTEQMRIQHPMVAVFAQLRDISMMNVINSGEAITVNMNQIVGPNIPANYHLGPITHPESFGIPVDATSGKMHISTEPLEAFTDYDLKECWPFNLVWPGEDHLITHNVETDEQLVDGETGVPVPRERKKVYPTRFIPATELCYKAIRDHFPLDYGDSFVKLDYDTTLANAVSEFVSVRYLPARVTNRKFLACWFSSLPGSYDHVRDDVYQYVCCARLHPNAGASFAGLSDYQRLEFLGDAVLGMLIAEWLNKLCPDAREGPLSWSKAILQSNRYLCRVFIRKLMNDRDSSDANEPVFIKPSELLYHNFHAEQKQFMNLDNLQDSMRDTDPGLDFEFCLNELIEEDKTRVYKPEDSEEAIGEPAELVSFNKYKFLADVYEAMVGVTLIEMRFDVRAVWEVIKGDYITCEPNILKHMADEEFVFDERARLRKQRAEEIDEDTKALRENPLMS